MMIKLYPRSCVFGMVQTKEEAEAIISEIKGNNEPLLAEQEWKEEIKPNTRRKKYKWDYEVSFYEKATLEEMKQDKTGGATR